VLKCTEHVYPEDLLSLCGSAWLNDTIINMYMHLLHMSRPWMYYLADVLTRTQTETFGGWGYSQRDMIRFLALLHCLMESLQSSRVGIMVCKGNEAAYSV
jgi:hypothetical protein